MRRSIELRSSRRRIVLAVARQGATYTLLIFIAAAMVLPFLWMISTSLKQGPDVFRYPPVWMPDPPQWRNYVEITERYPFLRWALNSILVAVLFTVGQLLTCSLAAYVFARFHFPGRNGLFILLLSTLMVPLQVTLIPQFVIIHNLGLMDTHLALWGPGFLGGAFGTFLMRQYFLTIPMELEDAARIDGCSSFGFYWRILMPLSKPALATLAFFSFMLQWNNLLGPVMYLSTREKMTLPLGLAFLRGQPDWGATPWHLVMAASVVTLAPILVIFFLIQKYYVRGIVMTGIK